MPAYGETATVCKHGRENPHFSVMRKSLVSEVRITEKCRVTPLPSIPANGGTATVCQCGRDDPTFFGNAKVARERGSHSEKCRVLPFPSVPAYGDTASVCKHGRDSVMRKSLASEVRITEKCRVNPLPSMPAYGNTASVCNYGLDNPTFFGNAKVALEPVSHYRNVWGFTLPFNACARGDTHGSCSRARFALPKSVGDAAAVC